MDNKHFWEVIEARLNRDKAKQFLFAGNACFTLRNATMGSIITFKVAKPRGRNAAKYPQNLYFVQYKFNEDTTDGQGYMPIGYVLAPDQVKGNTLPIHRITVKQNAKLQNDKRFRPEVAKAFENGVKVFNWFAQKLFQDALPETLEVYHAGRCGRCGKRLTLPGSIELSYGPECISLMGGVK